MTKRDYFNKIKTLVSDTDVIAFCDAQIALLDKKAEASKNATRKPTKVQIANEALKNDILGFIADKTVVIADVAANFDLSTQKVTPLMNALVSDGKLAKTVEKRKAHYSVIG